MANPPASVTLSEGLRGNIVRLDCPHELPEGLWDGPIYAHLREAQRIKPGYPSPFVIDDSSRRPGWVCDLIHRRYDPAEPSLPTAEDVAAGLAKVVIPYSRLSSPSDDLSRELRDRPLLLLFRFVRFCNSFITDAGGADPRLEKDLPDFSSVVMKPM
ncbi:hypothetical protein V7S43_004803 [Phytophthora oleae]|uniref:Uncharacterized protein n=1 Tax=Phytophthora oleae TaxID=2107226 RepID=A0ABD3FW76_9STRA